MFFGKIIHNAGNNAAFGLQKDLVADRWGHVDRVCKRFLAGALTVDVGVFEKVAAKLQRRCNEFLGFFSGNVADAHAAEGNGRDCQSTFSKLNIFHIPIPPPGKFHCFQYTS